MDFVSSYDESVIVISGISNSRAVMNASGCYELQLPAMKALTDKNGIQNVFLRTLQSIIKIREMLQSNARCIEIDVSIDSTTEQDDEHVLEEDGENTVDENKRKKFVEVKRAVSVVWIFQFAIFGVLH